MSEGHKKKRLRLPQAELEVDLVPMIDCIFLLLLFFMLCGRISMDKRGEMITVPPAKTAINIIRPENWRYMTVSVFGDTSTRGGLDRPKMRMSVKSGGSNETYSVEGLDNLEGYQKLRQALDLEYSLADKFPDPKNKELQIPKVILEIRGDSETEYRVIQEIQQVASDTISPFNGMQAKIGSFKDNKPFIFINFTCRDPTQKG